MRVITSDYIENKIAKLEKDPILADFLLLSYDDKVLDLNKKINDNLIKIKNFKKDKNSYIKDKELKTEIKTVIHQIKLENNIYKEYLNILKKQHILELENIRLAKINIDENIINLTAYQVKILDNVLNNNLINSSFADLPIVCKYMISNYSVYEYEKEILNIIKKLIENISFENVNDERIIIELNSINGEISKKLAKLDKDSLERPILNNFKSLIKNVINISKITFMSSYDYKFDIIDYWLNDEENKIFIEKIFKRLPETINIRTNSNEHIINYVLDKYIESYKIELCNQSKPMVSSSYLKEVLKMLYNSNNLELFDSDDVLFKNKLMEYEMFLKNSNYKRERILAALEDLNNLKNIDEKKDISEEVNELEVNDQLSYIKDIIDIENNNRQRIDLTNEETVAITNSSLKYNNYSYIIHRIDARNYSVKINVVDIDSLIPENSPLDLYLHNKMFSEINNNDYLFPNISSFSLSENGKMPTITFELLINEKGEVTNFESYKSITRVNKVISNNTRLSNNNMPLYYQLLNVFNNDYFKGIYLGDLEQIINQCCIRSVAKYFVDNNYPFIYKVQSQQNSEVFEKNINALNGIFYKISKEDFRIIYSIVCEDYNFAYYDMNNTGHKNQNSKYYSDLLNPLDSYIGICLQRLMKEYYFSKNSVISDNYTIEYLKNVIEKANSYKNKKRRNKQKVL